MIVLQMVIQSYRLIIFFFQVTITLVKRVWKEQLQEVCLMLTGAAMATIDYGMVKTKFISPQDELPINKN